jgi:putative sugar O-methyltransferase
MPVSIGELRSLHDTLAQNQEIIAFYEKLPRTNLWGKQNHEISNKIVCEAADTRDLIDRMQRTTLFGVNSDTAFRKVAIEWLVTKYKSSGIDLESLPAQVEESQYSCPDISADRAGRRLSVDFLRTLAVAHDIRRYIQQSRPPLRVVELGSGLGHLARTLRLTGVSKSHILLDLPESLIFAYAFLTLNFPDASAAFITDAGQAARIRPAEYDFVFVPSCFAEYLDFAGVELFVNTCSLGEMNNQTIRYWMDFVQRRTRVKYLFTQNRFLNTIDPSKHAWRWDENECSVHYDSSWTILKWDLESPWYQCPYIAPLSARSVDIAATREVPQDSRTLPERGVRLLDEVKQEDWFRLADTPPDMTVRQNRFVTDVTMTGALFKLWESIRLYPTAEAVSVLLRYLETLIHSEKLVFEETRYYQELLLKMTGTDHQPDSNLSALRERYSEPTSAIELLGETRDFNIVSAVCRVFTATEYSDVKRYYAIAKATGPVELLRERFGNREPSGYKFVSDTLESVIQKAKAAEEGPPVVRLEGSLDGYSIIGTHSGFLAVAHSLGQIDLFQERIGERELAPFILKAGTYEEIRKRIKDRS